MVKTILTSISASKEQNCVALNVDDPSLFIGISVYPISSTAARELAAELIAAADEVDGK